MHNFDFQRGSGVVNGPVCGSRFAPESLCNFHISVPFMKDIGAAFLCYMSLYQDTKMSKYLAIP